VRRPAPRGGHRGTRRQDGARSGLVWSENGDLSRRAQHEFDILVTTDRNLPFQQDLSRFSIAIIVLRAQSNRLIDLRRLIPELLAALPVARRGAVTWVGAEQRA
jgi:hypothetical protein